MLQSLFQNKAGLNSGMPMESWQTPQLDQRKTINSTLPSIMGTQTPTATSNPATISGVKFNRPTGWVDEFGGNGELMGVSQWDQYFEGLSNLGEGYSVEGVNGQGYAGIGGAPNSFTINRADPNGDKNVYQQRQLTVNPDGTVSWANDSNWVSKKQQSQMGHFLEAGLPMALAMVGGVNLLSGMQGAAGGLSGMDLAADAALGSGNNVMTAGQALTGSGGLAGTGIPAFTQAPGYGETVATLADASGVSPFTGAAAQGGAAFDPLAAYMTTGASEGSTIGGALLGGGGAGAVGQGTVAGTLGSLMANPITNFLGKRMAGTVAGNIVGNILGGNKGSGVSTAGNLGSLFSNYNQYKNMGGLIDEIKSIYKPDGAYAKTLENELARRDAAAGRNSQYGPRLTELMGRLGDSQARALSGLGDMYATQQGGMNGMIGAGTRLAGDLGLTDWLGDTLGGMFSSGIPAGSLGTTPAIWDRPEEDIDWEELFGG